MKSENLKQFKDCEIHEGEFKTIGQVADHFKISTRTLRFYEQMGLLNPVKRKNRRLFFRSHRERISNIIRYQEAGISLRQIKELLDDDVGSIMNIKCKFDQSAIKQMIARLHVRGDEINAAIAQFESILTG